MPTSAGTGYVSKRHEIMAPAGQNKHLTIMVNNLDPRQSDIDRGIGPNSH